MLAPHVQQTLGPLKEAGEISTQEPADKEYVSLGDKLS